MVSSFQDKDPVAAGAGAGLSNSELLQGKIRLAYPSLQEVANRFWTDPDLDRLYPEFLFLVHTMIRGSVPMMLEAAAVAREKAASGDEGAALLADYFEHHAKEETGHDDWLLDDLEVLGVAREEVWARRPSLTVARLVGAFYYWIRHVDPVALLGYLAVLEGNPPSVEHLQRIQRTTGLPEKSFRTLVKHAHLDPHHRDDLHDLIDRLPLTREQHTLLALSAFHTLDQVSLAFQEVVDTPRS